MNQVSWPHAPPHWVFSPGLYFVTASTYHREPRFATPEKCQVVITNLIDSASEFDWQLKAWVVLNNHYHFLARSPNEAGTSLSTWLREFHRRTAGAINQLDSAPGRRVWMNYRESLITHQTSFLARINYIHQNPVKHGLVAVAEQYPWSSYHWFSSHAPCGFVQSVGRFSTDRLNVWDDF
jgi:putative transposase